MKRWWLRHLARRYRCRTLIETGTYRGDMVAAMVPDFDRLLTVELDPGMAAAASERFHDLQQVRVVAGDSGEVLRDLLPSINERCAFWLDGHYSGPGTAFGSRPTPILSEIETIARHHRGDHLILIDDARCFGSEAGYPDLPTVTAALRAIAPGYEISIRDDMIRALPGSAERRSPHRR